MKSTLLIALLLVLSLVVTLGFTKQNKNMPSTNVRLNIKDLPEQGLKIIAPSDASYSTLVSRLLQGAQSPSLQALLPYSVILSNTSDRTVIACRLKWQFTDTNGKVKTRPSGFITFGPFMGTGVSNTDPNTDGNLIKPKSSKLFTPSVIDARDINTDPSLEGDNSVRMQADYIQRLVSSLAQYTNITVSLDGLFFDDGSFIGPDETNFFAYVEGMQRARLDTFSEVQRGLKQGKTARELLNQVGAASKAPRVKLSSASTSADFYNYEKGLVANELLRIKGKVGDEGAVKYSVAQLNKPWLKLQKK